MTEEEKSELCRRIARKACAVLRSEEQGEDIGLPDSHQRGQQYVDKPDERQYARGTSGEVVGASKSPENAEMDSPAEFNLMPIVGGGKVNEANTPAQNQARAVVHSYW
jgi:hypothetical protein